MARRNVMDGAIAEAVAGLRPRSHVVAHIVENEFALIGLHGQNRVALIVEVLHHRHKQRLARQAFLDQELAL